MRHRYLLLPLLLALVFAGCRSSTASEPSPPAVDVSDLQFVSLHQGARLVTGTLTLGGDVRAGHVQVQLSLFDADNRRIGTETVTLQDVAPGMPVAFEKRMDTRKDVRGVRVRDVVLY